MLESLLVAIRMSGCVNGSTNGLSSLEATGEQRFSFGKISKVTSLASSVLEAEYPSVSQDTVGLSATNSGEVKTVFCEVNSVVKEGTVKPLSEGEEEEVEWTVLALSDNFVVTQSEDDPLNPCSHELSDYGLDVNVEELRKFDERLSGSGRRRGRPALYPRSQSPWLRRSVRPAGRPRIYPVGKRPVYIRTGRPAGRPRKESRLLRQYSSDESYASSSS
ncbi:hypothetical protein V9T40_012394 [Parthenolecanium corni]|uniref:Uncharacterized protein n=1 Tax=Parthenolecanium corni TaxID=536013 RepID=A0AAN9Y0H7_9HEMI